MERSRYKIYENDVPHFLTFIIINYIPLFTYQNTVQIMLDALMWRQQHENVKVYAYMILKNHLYGILQADELRKQILDFKAHTTQILIAYLQQKQMQKILYLLKCFKKSHKKDAIYKVWKKGSHLQLMSTQEMQLQKLASIYHNPVKWDYVSSASQSVPIIGCTASSMHSHTSTTLSISAVHGNED